MCAKFQFNWAKPAQNVFERPKMCSCHSDFLNKWTNKQKNEQSELKLCKIKVIKNK